MIANEGIFHDLVAFQNSRLRLGNGALVEVKGKGSIVAQTKKGSKYIRDILITRSKLGPKLVECWTTCGEWLIVEVLK